MPATVKVPGALAIGLTFARGVYSGATLGVAEDLPEHSRVHEAFVAAAGGGPMARPQGNVLVALDEHRRALQWLERNEPLGLIVPGVRMTAHSVRRYRWRASPVAPADTDFEPFSALAGPIVYLWPPAPDDVVSALRELASEVTHVGRADSMVLVSVEESNVTGGPGLHLLARGRGTGRVMRVARPGRFDALARAHVAASAAGRHGPGSLGRQASDEYATGANDEALELRRFAPAGASVAWPFAEVWQLQLDGRDDHVSALVPQANRVAAAVGVHKALVRRVGDDVPAFVTGRDGDGPLRGAGHLAIHVVERADSGTLVACLAIPVGVADADREQLARALRSPLRVGVTVRRGDTRWFTMSSPTRHDAAQFWPDSGSGLRTAVAMVLDVNGGPRRQRWTLDDAVVCSIGFAMRGVLEDRGITWGSGWAFRCELVRALREQYGVDARASRVRDNALRYAHRVGGSDLVVATHARVELGTLKPPRGAGFLALGRARHLGGGLLIPAGRAS